MRFTTVLSLLFACWALLSGSPATYAAPIPSGVKRGCDQFECRIAGAASGSSTNTNTTSQSSNVQTLVKLLMNALQTYQDQTGTPSNTTTTVDLATPEDQSEPVPVIDALLGDSSPAP